MKPIRVLIVNMPRIQRDIIGAALSEDPVLELIDGMDTDTARCSTAVAVAAAVERAGADIVINGQAAGEDAVERLAWINEVLLAHPGLVVFSVADYGRSTVRYEMHPVASELGEASARDLLAAVQAAVWERRIPGR
jgi:hypothetical protein